LVAVEPYTYRAVIRRVVDGDTLAVAVDLGFGLWHYGMDGRGLHLRLLGCNARELEQPGGREAKRNLAELLVPYGGVLGGSALTLHTVKDDKYGGRYDAAVQLDDGTDLVELLVSQQWAAAWDGTGERPVPPWPRTVTT
jgi:endonuclease YncB( thermonuclease family)